MSDSYVECLVEKENTGAMAALKYVCVLLAVASFLLTIVMGSAVGFLGVIGFAVLAYFCHRNSAVEYEYLYVDRTIVVDKITCKSNRKKMGEYAVDGIEICAPVKSWHLGDYKNRNCSVMDYSIGVEKQPDERYVIYYEGNKKLILSPTKEFVEAVKNVAPRKVFMD